MIQNANQKHFFLQMVQTRIWVIFFINIDNNFADLDTQIPTNYGPKISNFGQSV